MRIGHLELFVANPSKSKDFFVETLGFKVESIQAEGRIVWMSLGDSVIMLRPGQNPPIADDYQKSNIAPVLYTDDLPAAVERLKNSGAYRVSSETSNDCHTFVDPDGNWFQIVDPRQH